MIGDAVVEADTHAAIVVKLAVVDVPRARCRSSVELANDPVVLVKQRRAG